MPLKVGLKYIDIWKDSMEDAVLRYENEPQYKDQIVFYDNCTFADLLSYEPLQHKDIFVKDGVHFNEEGYHAYASFFREVLKDELKQY
jgi:lysophospholipase L1-like esterase